jgi:hypothetical protein
MATRKSAAPKKPAPAATAQAEPTTPKKTDWQAVERDYRTGKFTLRELEAKHGANNATILRRAKREGWTADLSKAVRQATNAALVQQVISEKCSAAQQDTAETVLAAAELNKQVILGHRKDLSKTQELAQAMLAELADGALLLQHRELLGQILAGDGADPVDVAQAQAAISKALGIGNRVQALKALAETFTKIQTAERVAFGLDDKDDDGDKDPVSQALADFFSGIHGAAAGRLGFAPANKA